MDYKNFLEQLLSAVVSQNGSDLHFSEGRYPTIRVNGELIPLLSTQILEAKDTIEILKHLVSPERIALFEKELELNFAYEYSNGNRFRGNAFVQQGKAGVVLRLISNKIPTIEELNLPTRLYDFARKKQGFFLTVGPVGQGKSTTLASMLEQINQERAEHVITIEQPIEYVYTQKKSIVDQREVPIDTKDFYTGLIGTLRQDVDVILVGEMRDNETIQAAVTAAETGHLVFSTLHTNNASQTIDRIIDSFPAEQQDQIRIQLSTSLLGIFSQRLIPRISGGMIPAYELLVNNSAVSNLIREGRTHEIDTVIETGRDIGMIDMNRTLADLVRRGEITTEDAFAYSLNPAILEKLI
jgi:twitching motility protein PilT